jgi:hypothetical protein
VDENRDSSLLSWDVVVVPGWMHKTSSSEKIKSKNVRWADMNDFNATNFDRKRTRVPMDALQLG